MPTRQTSAALPPAAKKAPVRKAVPVPRAPGPAAALAASGASKPVKSSKPAKPRKPAKKPPKVRPVLVRDGFTMPEADFSLIATLKARTMAAGRATKKSELLRAGLQVLAALESKQLLAALNSLEPIKIGRPGKAD